VDPRTGQDAVENRKFLTLPGLELRPLCRPAIPAPSLLLLLSLFNDVFNAVYLGYICALQENVFRMWVGPTLAYFRTPSEYIRSGTKQKL
jgi:hypothetical protein